MADNFRPGDHKIIDDRTGRTIYASEARKEWTGELVHKDDWEPRHPQDLVRSRVDRMSVRDPRPRPPDVFIGPLVTAIATRAEAGDVTLHLESAVRMRQFDVISVVLDGGDTFWTTINSVTNETDIIVANHLPDSASPGNQVTDNTAMSEPEIG
jgi:hypothetical protein